MIKLPEPYLWPSPVTSRAAWLSCLLPPFISSPLCARLFLPLVLTLPLVSFETSKMKSLTKVCFQPRSSLSWGLVNNGKHPETRTPLLTDPVLLFFFSLRYLKLKKKLPHHSQQASLYCKNGLSDRHSISSSAWLTAAFQNGTLTERKGKSLRLDWYWIRGQKSRAGWAPRRIPSPTAGLIKSALMILLANHRDVRPGSSCFWWEWYPGKGKVSWSAEEPHTRTLTHTPPASPHALLSAALPGGVGAQVEGSPAPERGVELTLSASRSAASSSGDAREQTRSETPSFALPSGIPRGCQVPNSKISSFPVLSFLPILNFSIVTFGSEWGLSTVCGEQIVPTLGHNSSSSVTGRGLAAKSVAILGIRITLLSVPLAQGRQRQVTKCGREGRSSGQSRGRFDVYFAEIDHLGVEGAKSNLGTMVLP